MPKLCSHFFHLSHFWLFSENFLDPCLVLFLRYRDTGSFGDPYKHSGFRLYWPRESLISVKCLQPLVKSLLALPLPQRWRPTLIPSQSRSNLLWPPLSPTFQTPVSLFSSYYPELCIIADPVSLAPLVASATSKWTLSSDPSPCVNCGTFNHIALSCRPGAWPASALVKASEDSEPLKGTFSRLFELFY